jgi:hypothetical protein
MNVHGLECIYCGDAATDRDHVVAWSLTHMVMPDGSRSNRNYSKDEVVAPTTPATFPFTTRPL